MLFKQCGIQLWTKMKKSDLVNKIKDLVKELTDNKPDTPEKGDGLPISRFDLIMQFPELRVVLVDLMTEDYEQFLKNVYWVAPKPTTFKIILINNQHFFLLYDTRSWIARIEGKKYYLLEQRDKELASEAISRILYYGEISDKKGSKKGGEEGNQEAPQGTEETPETPEEEKPEGETPEEETIK